MLGNAFATSISTSTRKEFIPAVAAVIVFVTIENIIIQIFLQITQILFLEVFELLL